MTATATLTQPTIDMEQAYLEYRRACSYIIYRHAQQRGFLERLSTPKTLDEIVAEMEILPERRETLHYFIDALVKFGAISPTSETPVRYQATPGFSDKNIDFDHNLITHAIGREKLDGLLHGQNYAGIIDTLYEQDNRVAADFSSSNTNLWNEFLQMPFYVYGRQRAVQAITKPGGFILDCASGPGFGLRELAGEVGERGFVFGLEISRNFVGESVQRVQDLPNVRVAQCDLENGFAFLRDSFFDGAMIVGALHFIKNRQQFFNEVARVLKPGGKFCPAYSYMKLGAPDQELMDLRFHLRQPPSVPPTRDEVIELARRAGLTLEDEWTMGCFGSYVFVKRS